MKLKNIDVLISKEELNSRVTELGSEISHYYGNSEVIVISVLNGAAMFTMDLIKHFQFPVNLQFVKASSYGSNQISSGNVELNLQSVGDSIKGKKVLVIEDIVDTGHTYHKITETLKQFRPDEIKFASLLFKPARLEREVSIDYLAFEIEDQFVIGYGLDLDGLYRELPFVGIYNTGA